MRWRLKTFLLINGIEITSREILASIAIVLVMLIVGMSFSGDIRRATLEKKQEYNTAVDITTDERFDYGLRTDAGRAFCYGILSAVDTVMDDRIPGEFMYIYCEEQHYNAHTRTVTRTDAKGHTYTTTEVYYSWDHAGSETKHSQTVHFLGKEFSYDQIDMPDSEYLTTQYRGHSVRFKFYVCPVEYTGTMYTMLSEHTIQQAAFYAGQDISQTRDGLMQSAERGVTVFWVVWGIVTVVMVIVFCALENRWLK